MRRLGYRASVVSLALLGTSLMTHVLVVVFDLVDTNWDFEAHLAWSTQFSQAFRAGDPYPRWMPLGNHSLGEPVTLFYSPLFYYFTAVSDWFLAHTWTSMKWLAVLSTWMAGLAVWFLMRTVVTRVWALLAAVCVQFAPMVFMIFHYFNGYPWGASFATYAFCLLFTVRFFVDERPTYLAPMMFAAFSLILCHIVSAVMVFLCIGVSTLVLTMLSKEKRFVHALQPLLLWGVSLALSIGAAFFYLWPALTSLDLVAASNWQERYPPQNAFAFPTLTAYLFGIRWFTFQWVTPVLVLVSAILGAIAYRYWHEALSVRERKLLRFTLTLTWVSLFFSSELSYPLWLEPSPLLWVQSPYRFTYVGCLPAILINVFWLCWLWKARAGTLSKAIYLTPVVLSLALFGALVGRLTSTGASMAELELIPIHPYGSYPEYHTAAQTDKAKTWVEAGALMHECASLGITCIQQPIGGYRWTIESREQVTVRLPILSFPSWRVLINGVEENWRTDSETGLIEVDMRPPQSLVTVEWKRLPQETTGLFISLVSLSASLVFMIALIRAQKGQSASI